MNAEFVVDCVNLALQLVILARVIAIWRTMKEMERQTMELLWRVQLEASRVTIH